MGRASSSPTGGGRDDPSVDGGRDTLQGDGDAGGDGCPLVPLRGLGPDGLRGSKPPAGGSEPNGDRDDLEPDGGLSHNFEQGHAAAPRASHPSITRARPSANLSMRE